MKPLSAASKHIVLIGISLLCVLPLYFMLTAALKSDAGYAADPFGLPLRPQWGNLTQAFSRHNFARLFANSALLTLASIVIGTFVASLAAYAFSRMEFRGKRAAFPLVISLMSIPPVVMVIPLFVMVVKAHLINTYTSAVIIYVGLTVPFSIYLLTSFFNTVPKEMVDAAVIDGCSTFGVYRHVMMPLARPAIATLAVVNALWIWNDLLIALIFLQEEAKRTLMVGITVFQAQYTVNIPLTMAGLSVATIPMLVLYLATQRFIVQGLVTGALKQ